MRRHLLLFSIIFLSSNPEWEQGKQEVGEGEMRGNPFSSLFIEGFLLVNYKLKVFFSSLFGFLFFYVFFFPSHFTAMGDLFRATNGLNRRRKNNWVKNYLSFSFSFSFNFTLSFLSVWEYEYSQYDYSNFFV